MEFIRRHKKKIMVIFSLMWLGAILFLSGQKGTDAFELTFAISEPIAGIIWDNPDYDRIHIVMQILRQTGRVVCFAVLGALIFGLVNMFLGRSSKKRRTIVIVAVIIFISIFDETRKLLIDGRHCTIWEIMANILSGFAGSAIVWKISKCINRRT